MNTEVNSTPWAQIKACVFDAYGTLFDVHSAAARVAGELGPNKDSISNLWRQKQLEYTWLRSLMKEHVDFWKITGDALDFALESHSIQNPQLRAQLMELYLKLEAYPEVPACLQRLKAVGIATAVLSNGEPKMMAAAIEFAGLGKSLDYALSVEDVGVYKPDSRVYQMAVDRLGVTRQEICFVSSNTWDATAAAHFGFQVAWLNRFNRLWDKLPGTPKAVISTLDDLPVPVRT